MFLIREKYLFGRFGEGIYISIRIKKNNFNDNLTEILRKKVIKKLNVISALTNGEVELIKQIYKFDGRSYDAFYPLPVKLTDFEVELFEIDEFSITEDDFYIIGNSGDPTNNHITIINMLYLKKYNGYLYFPLAYGDKDYIKEVTEYANKVFPSKCYFQYDFISPNKYNHIMIEAKGGIFNHNRQQALGNILSLLYHNKEVYMNKNILSFKDLKSRGVSIFDLNEFGNVIPQQNNKKIIEDNFSDKKASELWAMMIKDLIHEKN
ncbi:TDP-N-acetylfucosamine:lipid II N-acetylfucosaminyltransferase [Photobacterium leiognathi]|uniref:TDP-N-acetylfucosamine:lipid II N-acetylfucosaminyltransferase n=1 Tax=Photobacterium leiognathi TaxID=553611 RepID=UPI00273826E8|nr:TDP-N-acetylfucosamine:lipid II N-acetylfucosaminyltransferase [Photobacterium leiognathi]